MSEFLRKTLHFLSHVVIFMVVLVIVLPLSLFVYLCFQLIGCRSWLTEDEVYEQLSFTEWKTGIEIREGIRKQRLTSQRYAALFDSVYPILYRLVEEELAERQEKQLDSEILKQLNGLRQHRYRRKPGGIRTRKDAWSRFTLPIPVPSWSKA